MVPESAESRRLFERAIRIGWLCVAASAVFLYLSRPGEFADAHGQEIRRAIYLMAARLSGIGSFAIGSLAIYNRRWTTGLILLILSMALPFVAFHWHGTF